MTVPLLYQPFYCEENIWHLTATLGPANVTVLFFCNSVGAPFWHQRAGHPVIWDYHVVAAHHGAQVRIYDLDTTLPLPCDALTYLEETFPAGQATPLVRLVPGDDYRRLLVSDRSHMRLPQGSWQAPPPPWPCVGAGATSQQASRLGSESSTLPLLRDETRDNIFGGRYNLADVRRFIERRQIACDTQPDEL